jgi:hypothetical protein
MAATPPHRIRSEDDMKLPPYPNSPLQGMMTPSIVRRIFRISFSRYVPEIVETYVCDHNLDPRADPYAETF